MFDALKRAVTRWRPMPHPNRAPAAFLFADISSNNGGLTAFNPTAYSKAGHLLIGIKATEGDSYVNPMHYAWTVGAHGAHVAVLHYHFVTGKTTAAAEAAHFWANVKSSFDHRCDRLAIDFEGPAFTALGSRSAGYLSAFDAELHKLSGQWAIGYTFRSALSSGLRVRSGKWWVASFGSTWPAAKFRRLPDGTMWAWQFTDGKLGAPGPRGLTGIAGTCDVSVLSPPIVVLLRKALRR